MKGNRQRRKNVGRINNLIEKVYKLYVTSKKRFNKANKDQEIDIIDEAVATVNASVNDEFKKNDFSFFNVESLKEQIQTIAEKLKKKYQRLLLENEEKLDIDNNKKQCDLYLQVWNKLQNGSKSVNIDEMMDGMMTE
ncbi:hypothetical protein RFI_19303 [Reticulomyxa filosa]|uniref:Uncharacterized protein n=1 Tax=Reticulomyxa filosa TaxID=46433 RepID=X6MWI3_RETFI|nr:hypothetical protein RFI_19303 [Reticulomyxa filosa]|eukprot:ETO17991.1 hypothetical protein RFI_19303 [Reticulomyxa filosa]